MHQRSVSDGTGGTSPRPLPPRKTKLTLTAVKMPDSVTHCQGCKGARDTVVCYCNQCDLDLCLTCDGTIHGKEGDAASHVRTYFRRVVYGDRTEIEPPKESVVIKDGESEVKIEREAHVNLRRQKNEGTGDSRTLSQYRDDPRFKAVFDIYMTEREYCDNLHKLLENYIKPLNNASAAFSEAGVGAKKVEFMIEDFLSNIEPMFHLNSLLCRALHDRLKQWNTEQTLMGDLFLDNAPLFELYRVYAKEHLAAQTMLDREYRGMVKTLEDSAKRREMDREARKHQQRQDSVAWRPSATSDMDMTQLLTLPVTRISKYVLFLEFLLRATKDAHPDFVTVTRALNVIKATNDDVTNRVAEARNLLQLDELKALFINANKLINFVKPHRFLVLEKLLKRSTRKGFKEYYFHLLNDLLLYSSPAGKGTYRVHRELELATTIVTDRPQSDDEPHALQVNNSEKSFVLQFADEADKKKWHKALEDCIQHLAHAKYDEGERKHVQKLAPVWTDDTVSALCLICKSKFSLVHRRHHCRNCGILVCNSCSNERRLLKNIDKKALQRVCLYCAEKLPPPAEK